jgi:hypothetical protein
MIKMIQKLKWVWYSQILRSVNKLSCTMQFFMIMLLSMNTILLIGSERHMQVLSLQ